jgi:hypothetical protein
MNWHWVAIAAAAPLAVALLAAYPLWRRGQSTFGSTAASMIVFIAGALMIAREYAELERLTEQCIAETGYECLFDPSPFARFATYAGVALLQAFAIFMIGIKAEERRRRMDYAPEWRR